MKSIKALFVLALGLVLTMPAFAETQNVKVSGSLDAYAMYRGNFDLTKNNDRGVTPAGAASAAGLSVNNHADPDQRRPHRQRVDGRQPDQST
jgi:hypothetical protein